MSSDTDLDWEFWGRTEPYFGVLSHPKFLSASLHRTRLEFWATGRREVATSISRYEAAFGSLPTGTVLDFGCGVGRLSLPLADRFEHVVGLDVSPSMLAEAQRNARGISNIEFRPSDDALSHAPEQLAFIFSIIVFQHIPVKRGLRILANLLGRIQPGGGCHIHLLIGMPRGSLRRAVYWARTNIPGADPLLNLAVGLPMKKPSMHMNAYPLDDVFGIFHRAGMSEAQISLSEHGGILSGAFSARKPHRFTAAP